jgi:hypothetical protein
VHGFFFVLFCPFLQTGAGFVHGLLFVLFWPFLHTGGFGFAAAGTATSCVTKEKWSSANASRPAPTALVATTSANPPAAINNDARANTEQASGKRRPTSIKTPLTQLRAHPV